jgi:hypoxanthine phosphoribosyltransferase
VAELPKHHVEPYISEARIAERVRELAQLIAQDYAGQSIVLVGILSGAATLTADLGRALNKLGMADVEIDFMAVDSYGKGTRSTGEPKIDKDTKNPIAGKNVIVVEDIIDTGYSLERLLALLESRGAASLAVLTLLSKKERRQVEVPINYLGFEIPNVFVVGYGIDYAEQHRTRPDIGIVVFDE